MNIIVDLDGTLLKTDLISEALFSKLTSNYKEIKPILKLLLEGDRLKFKKYLFKRNNIDITTLPYNREVIEKIKKLKKTGKKIYLVTATTQKMADKIGKYLNLFDGIYGSKEDINLKGKEKSKFLNKKFGKNQFEYFGNSKDDIHVWKDASYAYLVNTNRTIEKEIKKSQIPFEKINKQTKVFEILNSALRSKQWVKNILIFLPIIAAQAFTLENFIASFYAFLAFSFIASGVYIFNDLLDIKADRYHKIKKNRVFASGEMQLETGCLLAVLLWIIGFIITLKLNLTFTMIMICYLIITSLYSLKIKKIPVFDLCILASLYTLRIWSGSVANEINLSVWLLALSIFLFYALACVKRLSEMVSNEETGNITIKNRGYDLQDTSIIQSMAISSGYAATIVFALYLNSIEIVKNYSYPPALWGVWLILLFWINYIIFMAHRGIIKEDPVIFAIRNKISITCGFIIIIFWFVGITYE